MESIIEIKELRRAFGDIRAVDGLTFEVQPGEVFGLLGPNGAGKTTTVRLLNRNPSPSSGTLRVFGLDPATQGEQVRQKTGVLTEKSLPLREAVGAREPDLLRHPDGNPRRKASRTRERDSGFLRVGWAR